MDFSVLGLYAMTEGKVFSCLARPNPVNKYFIIMILPFLCLVRMENCEKILVNTQ